jgi:small-conductance mechanosensitive channel
VPAPDGHPPTAGQSACPALRSLAVAAALVLASLSATVAQDAPDQGEPAGQIGVGTTEIADAEIRDRILRLLAVLDGYDGVAVSVSSGVVTLSGEVVDSAAAETLSRLVTRIEGVVAIDSRVTETFDLNQRLAPAVERLQARALRIVANLPIILVAILVFGLVFGLGWLATTRLRVWERIAPNAFIADIYRAFTRIGFAVAGLVVALDILNATALIGAVLGAAGVVGLAVGFAVRDTVENFIASILLSLRQPFRPDDVVDIDGALGSVARLTSRATILISPDGNQIRIPNATVFKGRIVNYTRDPQRRFVFTLGVDSDADLVRALAVGAEALARRPFVLDEPPVSAWIEEVGDSSVVLSFAGWTDQSASDFLKARGEAIRVTKAALEEAGMTLPEPIYRLRMEQAGSGAAPPAPPAEARPEKPRPAPSPLPVAAAPDRAALATERVMERERNAPDAQANLLRGRNAPE